MGGGRIRALRGAAGAALLVAALAPAAAHASARQLSIMQDDDTLLYRGQRTAANGLEVMHALGVDAVRVTVLWEVAAQRAASPRRAHRFRATDPRTYPHRLWDRYDDIVRGATLLGMRVYLNPTGPPPPELRTTAPRGAEARSARAWRPDARAFGRFVQALGKRYSGHYRDENQGRRVLPRVDLWSIWNEPNQRTWLSPQFMPAAHGKAAFPVSPILYRRLWIAAHRALVHTGHRHDTILMGETAPLGSKRKNEITPMAPGQFIRELYCLDAHLKPYRGAAARKRECNRVPELIRAAPSGWAHHPYTRNAPPTWSAPGEPDALPMGRIHALPQLLDALSAHGDLPPQLPVWLTEFGYETNPPDPFRGLAPDTQAEWLNTAEHMAYENPRIVSTAQYLLRDAPVKTQYAAAQHHRFGGYQSGLYDETDHPKPSLVAYDLPLVAMPGARAADGSRDVRFWGQLRFRPNGVAGDLVSFQFRPQGSDRWTTVGSPAPVSSPLGFFETARTATLPGYWRAVWTRSGSPSGQATSRQVFVQP